MCFRAPIEQGLDDGNDDKTEHEGTDRNANDRKDTKTPLFLLDGGLVQNVACSAIPARFTVALAVQACALVIAVRGRVGADRARLHHGAVLALVTRVAKALAVLAKAAGRTVVGAVGHQSTLGAKPTRVTCADLLRADAVAAAEVQVGARRRIGASTVLLRFPLGLALASALHASAAVHALWRARARHRLGTVLALEALCADTTTIMAHTVLATLAGALRHFAAVAALVAHVTHALGLSSLFVYPTGAMLAARLPGLDRAVGARVLRNGGAAVGAHRVWVAEALAVRADAFVAAAVGTNHGCAAISARKTRGAIAPPNLAVAMPATVARAAHTLVTRRSLPAGLAKAGAQVASATGRAGRGTHRRDATVDASVTWIAVALPMLADAVPAAAVGAVHDLGTVVAGEAGRAVALLVAADAVRTAVFRTSNKLCAVVPFPARVTVASAAPADAAGPTPNAGRHEGAVFHTDRGVVAEAGVAEALAVQAEPLVAAVVGAACFVLTGVTTVPRVAEALGVLADALAVAVVRAFDADVTVLAGPPRVAKAHAGVALAACGAAALRIASPLGTWQLLATVRATVTLVAHALAHDANAA